MKIKRHSKILELIEKHNIETQDELVEMLKDAGFNVAQATISRDIRELGLIKGAGQRYEVGKRQVNQVSERFINVFHEAVITITVAQNIIVIKTIAGMAMGVAAALDSMSLQEIVGSIAGDDTLFCVVHDEKTASSLVQRLKNMVKK